MAQAEASYTSNTVSVHGGGGPPETVSRKQVLFYSSQLDKLQGLAAESGLSLSEIVRRAVDAYDPDMPTDQDEAELLELVSGRLKEAIADTVSTRERLEKTIAALKASGRGKAAVNG
jgi:hypothetical protein